MPHYLDYHSHYPIDPRVLLKLTSSFLSVDANPHSTHRHGIEARSSLEQAREQVASLIDARPSEIVFTSGATEANNLVFEGIATLLKDLGRTEVLVSSTEHASVLQSANQLEHKGFMVGVVPVTSDGLLDMRALVTMMSEKTGLVSVAAANHEIGTLQDLGAVSQAVRSRGALFHSDLAQAAGKLPVSAGLLDLASLSAHKLGGPTGVGAMYVRRRIRPKMTAHLRGGHQESGLRSGTVPVPLCVAFGEACEIASVEMASNAAHVYALRAVLVDGLLRIPGSYMNGSLDHRLPGNANVRFDGVDAEALVTYLQDIVSISTGSACSARSLEPSHVLLAIGLSRTQAESSIRIGLGPSTTGAIVADTVDAIASAVHALRSVRNRA
ncbi:cysteine desulfurase IscS [Devosia yakushimensis]|uniref:Cysteine desulfurase n=1 Tax=Devosia yakushimensis TaxID=470028 RepID=A0ABQ5UMW3_9HYPH|nr:cysteine desulfurase family protein [Devosia yakushimensis]GLQ12071.1 cysteine desulfurase IscS [Devosia yakushimensis]